MMLLDRHADTMLMHGLLFELSRDASVDQENNPLADPKRLIKKLSTCPNSLPLQAHTPEGSRTPPVGSFDADMARVAPNDPTRGSGQGGFKISRVGSGRVGS